MSDELRARLLYCGEAEETVLSYSDRHVWAFRDYSWVCPACWNVHCSECSYAVDEERDAIIVRECGRFGYKAPPGSRAAETYGCRCPVLDNEHGEGFGSPRRWVIDGTCPVHVGSRRYVGGKAKQ